MFFALLLFFGLHFSVQGHATENLASCNEWLLNPKNWAVIQELEQLRKDVYQKAAHDRASYLLLKKDFDTRVAILARALNIDAKELGMMDFSNLLANNKVQTAIVSTKTQTRVEKIIHEQLKEDPDLKKILNWLHLLQAEQSKEHVINAEELLEFGIKENNLSAIKAALLQQESLLLPLDEMIKYNDTYLTQLWLANGGDPESRTTKLYSIKLNEFLEIGPRSIRAIEAAIKEEAWNVVNVLFEYLVNSFFMNTENDKNFLEKISENDSDIPKFSFIFM